MKALRRFMSQLRYAWLLRAEHLLLARQEATIERALAAAPVRELGPAHHPLIRRLRVTWVPIESGAPGLLTMFPFGWGQSTGRVGAALIGKRDEALLAKTLVEASAVIPQLAAGAATLRPGRYAMPADMLAYFEAPESGVTGDGMFDFRQEHALLLRYCVWRRDLLWRPCWPLPNVDGKRPYGASAYVELDMARILGQPFPLDDDGRPVVDEEAAASLLALHDQMTAALQVFLVHAVLPDRL